MIIGLTGRNGAGKGEVSLFLESRGFFASSLSDVIRDEIENRGLEITRERLIEVGRELRSKHGPSVLARRILDKVEEDRNYVVDSFRHPDEVRVFKTLSNFNLLLVQAESPIRFTRIQERKREQDPETLQEFDALEQRELANDEWQGQQLLACEGLADLRLTNENSLAHLHEQLSEMLQHLARNMKRPGWDEYFMKLAKVASLRSNCIKRKVAAIIVRDRRVVSTGYNGTPRGTKNCHQGGCPRCNSLAQSGTLLEECLCSHGEENSIIQAAYHGVSVKDGTLYTTFAPCLMCTKMIINAGIREVVYNQEYPLNETSLKLLGEAGVVLRQHRVE